MQLVDDDIEMLDPMKQRIIGPEQVIEKFGVLPEKVIDVQALAGDSSDNVPGVPGIGVKTAALLLGEYGDLETLLAQAEEIKQPKRRQNLIEFADLARVSKQLVTLKNDVPIEETLESFVWRPPDPDTLLNWIEDQGFKSLARKVAAELGAEASGDRTVASPAQQAATVKDGSYELVQDEKALDGWIERAFKAGVIAVDTETDALDGWRFAFGGTRLGLLHSLGTHRQR
jgi:DNA polymerase-1